MIVIPPVAQVLACTDFSSSALLASAAHPSDGGGEVIRRSIGELWERLRSSEIPAFNAVDWTLVLLLVPLLGAMAFFSFVETTYFALTPAERLALRRSHPRSAALVETLLSRPRILLVSTMLGSLVASTAYLVVSSVLVTRFEHSLL
ncbi:MAG: CNNM domain-containing protein, partial [bacterium]